MLLAVILILNPPIMKHSQYLFVSKDSIVVGYIPSKTLQHTIGYPSEARFQTDASRKELETLQTDIQARTPGPKFDALYVLINQRQQCSFF